MKLPNGYGSITKVKGNRRKSYRVYVTVGWNENGKQIKKSLGYVATYDEGLELLAEYHKNPYDLDYKNIKFGEIWEEVKNEITDLVEKGKMSNSNLECLSYAYNNHCTELKNEPVLTLRYKKIQDVIDNATNSFNGAPLGYTGKGYMVTVCKKIFDKAINIYELPINKDPTARLSAGEKQKSTKHKPFTTEELSILWGLQYLDIVKIILISCYGGERPNEIFTCKKDNIHIEDEYLISGSKTEAGKDRVIPIHPKVAHLVQYFYNRDSEYPFKTLFEKFNYPKFSREVKKLMLELGFDHTPYDGRHTFTTKMKQARADEYLLKRIIGHRIEDITEKTYTHRDISELVNEVKKIV